ncbi:MAG TPA: CotH kinase family protein [Candidatus Saccharimonadales bacterium]|nr:CotH kinase family protein [Candidatus Saccharimonadales bacterium]
MGHNSSSYNGSNSLRDGWRRFGQHLATIGLSILFLSISHAQQRIEQPASVERIPPVLLDTLHPAPALESQKLPVYELKMQAKALAELENSETKTNTYPATFTANGVVYEGIGVRFRGEWARSWPKKPLKVIFKKEKPFDGHHSLNLNSAWRDPSFLRETLAYGVYAMCGVPASKSRMAQVIVNGNFRGLYVEVEQPDEAFLKRVGLPGVVLYKAASDPHWADERDLGSDEVFATHYKLETHKTNGMSDLRMFCHDLAKTKDVTTFFNERVDLDKYINYLVATTLVQHWDCFNKNHYMAYEPKTKKWFAVPWDLDRTFGDHWHGGFTQAQLPILQGTRPLPGPTGWNRMEDRFFSSPMLKAKFMKRLGEVLEQDFTSDKLFPLIDTMAAQIQEQAPMDRARWPGPARSLQNGIAGVKSYIQRRRTFLLAEVARFQSDSK